MNLPIEETFTSTPLYSIQGDMVFEHDRIYHMLMRDSPNFPRYGQKIRRPIGAMILRIKISKKINPKP
jgi:hypothetical protein